MFHKNILQVPRPIDLLANLHSIRNFQNLAYHVVFTTLTPESSNYNKAQKLEQIRHY